MTFLSGCTSSRELVDRGWADDLDIAYDLNCSHCAPILEADLSYADFQRRYEQDGDDEYRRYAAMRPQALIDLVRAGRFGEQYTIWRVIGDTSSLELAGWVLFGVIDSGVDYLNRYHAASALLKLLRAPDLEAPDLTVNTPKRLENLAAVRRALETRLGSA